MKQKQEGRRRPSNTSHHLRNFISGRMSDEKKTPDWTVSHSLTWIVGQERSPGPFPRLDDLERSTKISLLNSTGKEHAELQATVARYWWRQRARGLGVCQTDGCWKMCWVEGELVHDFCCRGCKNGNEQCGPKCDNNQKSGPRKRAVSSPPPFSSDEDSEDGVSWMDCNLFAAKKIHELLRAGKFNAARDFVTNYGMTGPVSANFPRYEGDRGQIQLDRSITDVVALALHNGGMPYPSEVIKIMASNEQPSQLTSETVGGWFLEKERRRVEGNELSAEMGLRVKMVLVHECYVCAKQKQPYDNIAIGDDVKHMLAKNRKHCRKVIESRWKEEAYYKYMGKATEMGVSGEIAEKVGREAAIEMGLLIAEVNLEERLEIADIKKAKKEAAELEAAERANENA